jgi:hypothetical protein
VLRGLRRLSRRPVRVVHSEWISVAQDVSFILPMVRHWTYDFVAFRDARKDCNEFPHSDRTDVRIPVR